MTDKPQDIEAYKKWLSDNHKVEIAQAAKHYELISGMIRMKFVESELWTTIRDSLQQFDSDYQAGHNGFPLWASTFPLPDLLTKSFTSFLEKTFRRNVLDNIKWDKAPKDRIGSGWILPSNWFSRINDITRTCFVVKYFDGVQYLATQLEQVCRIHNTPFHVHYEARDEGYYAAHVYATYNLSLPGLDWTTEEVPCSIELQITTQLQDVIRHMLHSHYRTRRMQSHSEHPWKWKWNSKSPEFATNYMGHILHYLEGLIVDIRDKSTPPQPLESIDHEHA